MKNRVKRFCNRCDIESNEPICRQCQSITSFVTADKNLQKSSAGDKFPCTVWQGGNEKTLGIRFGKPNRDRYFSRDIPRIVLFLDDTRTTAEFTGGFWRDCPEIRVAKDQNGKNYLPVWLEKHHLLPPTQARLAHARVNSISIEVIVPENEFRATPCANNPGPENK